MTAFLGQGAVLKIDTVEIGQILSIDGPSMERAMVDTTNLGTSTLRTFVPGFGDGGELTIEVQLDDATDAGQQDVLESVEAGSATAEAIELTLSDGDKFSFSAFVRSFSVSVNIDEINRASIVFKVTGDVTHTSG